MNIEEALARRATTFMETKFRREKQAVGKNGKPYERVSFTIKEDETWFKIEAVLFSDRLDALGNELAQLDGQWIFAGVSGVTDESYDDEEKGKHISVYRAARVLFPSEIRALFGSPPLVAQQAPAKAQPQAVEEEDDGTPF